MVDNDDNNYGVFRYSRLCAFLRRQTLREIAVILVNPCHRNYYFDVCNQYISYPTNLGSGLFQNRPGNLAIFLNEKILMLVQCGPTFMRKLNKYQRNLHSKRAHHAMHYPLIRGRSRNVN